MQKTNNITQYFSKWRKCWVFFTDRHGNKYMPNNGELNEYRKYNYKLK